MNFVMLRSIFQRAYISSYLPPVARWQGPPKIESRMKGKTRVFGLKKYSSSPPAKRGQVFVDWVGRRPRYMAATPNVSG